MNIDRSNVSMDASYVMYAYMAAFVVIEIALELQRVCQKSLTSSKLLHERSICVDCRLFFVLLRTFISSLLRKATMLQTVSNISRNIARNIEIGSEEPVVRSG